MLRSLFLRHQGHWPQSNSICVISTRIMAICSTLILLWLPFISSPWQNVPVTIVLIPKQHVQNNSDTPLILGSTLAESETQIITRYFNGRSNIDGENYVQADAQNFGKRMQPTVESMLRLREQQLKMAAIDSKPQCSTQIAVQVVENQSTPDGVLISGKGIATITVSCQTQIYDAPAIIQAEGDYWREDLTQAASSTAMRSYHVKRITVQIVSAGPISILGDPSQVEVKIHITSQWVYDLASLLPMLRAQMADMSLDEVTAWLPQQPGIAAIHYPQWPPLFPTGTHALHLIVQNP